MKLTEPRREVVLVVDNSSLAQCSEALGNANQIGVDAERASGFRYTNKAYLVQFSSHDQIFLLDTTLFTNEQIATLASVVNTKTWVLHSATQDIPCLAELEFFPSSIFDTELAARLCGVEKFGLSSIALEFLDLEMAKEHSAADWSVRPLKEEMLNYAALDVDVLHELKAVLQAKLDEIGRSEWAEQEFIKLLSFKPKQQPKDAWRSLPGISKIKDLRKQQIAAGLHARRDAIAQEQDVAPGRLIPDRSIMAAVNQLPRSKSELAKNREFQGRASRSMLNEWWTAIEESKNLEIVDSELDPNHIPNHRSWEKRFPEAHQRLLVLREVHANLAGELAVAPEIILSPDTLRRIAFKPAADVEAQLSELGARKWQIQLVGKLFSKALEQLGD